MELEYFFKKTFAFLAPHIKTGEELHFVRLVPMGKSPLGDLGVELRNEIYSLPGFAFAFSTTALSVDWKPFASW